MVSQPSLDTGSVYDYSPLAALVERVMEYISYVGAGRWGTKVYHVSSLVGEKYGRLTVLRYVAGSSPPKWVCRCTCRRRVVVSGNNLKNGHTKSCGCLQRIGVATHGEANNPLYRIWANMWARCTDPKADRYYRYGGRGITVCDRWKDISSWLEDMGPRPEGYSIERKNRDGNYTPDNCKWASPLEQANNKSNNLYLTVREDTDTLANWARRTGVKAATIRKRIVDLGWSVERALGYG